MKSICVCFGSTLKHTQRSIVIQTPNKSDELRWLTEHMDGHRSQWSRRTQLWTTHTVYPNIHSYSIRKEPKSMTNNFIFWRRRFDELLNVKSCCRAKLSFPPTLTPRETHVRWDERWSGTGGCLERFSRAVTHSLHPSTEVAILWDHVTWSTTHTHTQTRARALFLGDCNLLHGVTMETPSVKIWCWVRHNARHFEKCRCPCINVKSKDRLTTALL